MTFGSRDLTKLVIQIRNIDLPLLHKKNIQVFMLDIHFEENIILNCY